MKSYALILVYMLVFPLIQGSAASPEARLLYDRLSTDLRSAGTGAGAVQNVLALARKVSDDHGQSNPDVAAKILFEAALYVSLFHRSEQVELPAYTELTQRLRRYVYALPLEERLSALYSISIPLNTEIRLHSASPGSAIAATELEILLTTWVELTGKLSAQNDAKFVDPGPYLQPELQNNDVIAELQRQDANAKWKAAVELNKYHLKLRNEGSTYTNRIIAQIVREYCATPHLVANLQEVLDGYLPPSVSTNVMNQVFAAMKPEVAAQTPRPVPGAKGERWLRAPAPAGEAALPAVARRSKLRDNLATQSGGVLATTGPGSAPASAPNMGGEQSGGGTVWPWAVLGLGTLLGGWLWLRQRA